MPKKKKPSTDLISYRLEQHERILNKIDTAVDNLRQDVLEKAIPAIDKKVENLKGKTTAWAAIISILVGGAVSTVIAFIR